MDFPTKIEMECTELSVRSRTRLRRSHGSHGKLRELEMVIAAMKVMEAIWPSERGTPG